MNFWNMKILIEKVKVKAISSLILEQYFNFRLGPQKVNQSTSLCRMNNIHKPH